MRDLSKRGGQDTESAKAKEERDEEGGERELGPGKDAEFRESQETMRWQEMKNLFNTFSWLYGQRVKGEKKCRASR